MSSFPQLISPLCLRLFPVLLPLLCLSPFNPSVLHSFFSYFPYSLCPSFSSFSCISLVFPCLPTPSFSSFTLLSFPPSLGYSRCYTVALGIAGEERPQAYVYSNVCVRITLCAYICLNMVVCACAHAQHICLCVYNATVYVSVCACVLY